MLMYHCNDCGASFEEPELVNGERLEHFGRPCHERIAVCPECGQADIEETDLVECSSCGDCFSIEKTNSCQDIYGDTHYICDTCAANLVKKLYLFVRDNFTDYERDLLLDMGELSEGGTE